MRRCVLDKIASVTKHIELTRNAVLSTEIPAQAGTVIAARVLNAKTTYDTLEDVHGRMVRLHPGDVIAGALGHRDALHGFSGVIPQTVSVGDHLQLLNKGGVIGAGAERAPGFIHKSGRLQERDTRVANTALGDVGAEARAANVPSLTL